MQQYRPINPSYEAASMVQTSMRPDYSFLVRKLGAQFELSIPELLLRVRAPSLQEAYERLVERKQKVIAAAVALGAEDEIPVPLAPPAIKPRR
jgi:hypothetical protein